MERDEIIKMYDHIRANGSGNGGPRARKRTVIADMMMYIDHWTHNGQKGFIIGREDGYSRWSIEFRLVMYVHVDDADKFRFSSFVASSARAAQQPLSEIARSCNIEILRWEGDYEAYRHDFTLLRMFSHEWFDES